MGKPHAVSQLEKHYSRIAGEIAALNEKIVHLGVTAKGVERLEAKRAKHREMLGHIQPCIKLFDPTWTPARITPKKPRQRASPFEFRVLKSMAWDVLRTAEQPMSTREILERLVTTDDRMKPEFARDPGVKSALTLLLRGDEEKGHLRTYGKRPIRWETTRL